MKFVYLFGGGKADGNDKMKNLLGGKGANLAEMAGHKDLRLPVPPGFTITTKVCTHYYANRKTYPKGLDTQVAEALAKVEKIMGKKFGDRKNPLLVSIQVEAMEAGEFGRLPDEPFLSGFLGNYARLVQLDPEPLLESIRGRLPPAQARELVGQQSPEVAFPTGQERAWGRYAAWGLLGILALGLLAYEGFQGYRPQGADGGQCVPAADPPSKPAPQPVPVLEAVPPVQPASGSPSPAARRALVMTFSAQTWVEVRDRDGQVIFSQVSPAGSSQVVEGNPPLGVVLGNAAGVQVSYGDQPVDLAPHTRENVARFTLE